MKYITYLFSALNLYGGLRFFLNAIGVLQTSKYGNAANVFFAITLTIAGIGALYISIANHKHGQALLANAAPWLFTLVLVVGSMLLGDYK